MNSTINSAYINALLSDACYVNGLSKDDEEENLFKKLFKQDAKDQSSAENNRLTEPLARFIADNFTVLSQYTAPLIGGGTIFPSGFSVTVWADKGSPAKKYVSFRGTEGGSDLFDLLTDANAYIGTGLAAQQVVEMINWYLPRFIKKHPMDNLGLIVGNGVK